MGNPASPAACPHRFRFQTILACLLACVWAVALTVEGSAQDHAGDKEALIALYNATDGDNWAYNDNWLSDEPLSTWYGVTVSDGRVTGLDFEGNQLIGTIPAELGNLASLRKLNLDDNQLTGPIPAELGNLASLTGLFLQNNQLAGTIPTELGDLASLTALGLSRNQLTGAIPTELGNLTSLTNLNLSNNQQYLPETRTFEGGLTGSIPTELGNLSNLRGLALGGNQLTGSIPPELGALSSLTNLNLWNNQLTGAIPAELGKLSNLTDLNLNNNQQYLPETRTFEGGLTGSIPTELGNLSNLRGLALGGNQLTGSIPPELGALSSLTVLHLWNNQLTGAIPAELGKLSNLTDLNLSNNQQYLPETRTFEGGLTGSIPTELANLSNLRGLALGGNQLTGSIPPELGALSSLTVLYLWGNQLTGAIPAELGKLSNLTDLNLNNNPLTGAIPAELGNLASLTGLGLSATRRYSQETATFEGGLTGSIPPELGNLANLTRLILNINQLTGPIPPELGKLAKLTRLWLSNNQLTGPIPPELGNLSSLTDLRLIHNQLTGPIPAELGDLANLTSLELSLNHLTGPIPAGLGDLASLTALGLGSNQLTGAIPAQLGGLANLTRLLLGGNQLTGTIPAELGNLASLTWLGLFANQLTGPIPPELGGLSSVVVMQLSGNQLTGPIPAELGNLASLTALYLNTNQLTGTIPLELSNLSSLGGLYLQNNRLTGPIPPWLGSLSSLRALYLHNNQLTGSIPPELGDLARLRALDLAGNQLTGTIPPELGNLSSLVALNLAGNQLTGSIPQSFTSLMLEHFYFHGNPGLSVPDDATLREWMNGINELRDQDYSPATPFVPVILSSAGRNNSFFTSELTLTNRGTVASPLTYTYTAHRGGGSGVANDILGPGEQRIIPNAIDYLRDRLVPIPGTGNRIGTLRVTLGQFSSSQVGVTVRTTTKVPEGRAGLAYPAVAAEAGFDEPVYLCGLRQNAQDRSNVAFQNMGTDADGPITLRTTVFSGDPEDSRPRVLEDRTLQPGGFYQYSGLLGVLTSVGGNRQGYVKVERVEGTAPFYAYGVINDQGNSDGSFVFPATASSLEGITGQTLPVIVETGVFTSELMVTNFSDMAKTVTFRFRADAVQTPDKTATVEWTFHPGQQLIVPNIVDMLRKLGAAGIGRAGQTFAGALFATVDMGDMSGIAIGARTSSSDGRGGQYGVYYNAVPYGGAFTESAWVEALQQNEENRSNLALVNTGEVDDSPSVFQLDIYDGGTRMLANTVTGLTVPAGGWYQINGILGNYAPGTTQGYVRISKISGNNPFLAYGIINDGGAPGQRSGDGAYLPPRE